MPNDVPRCVLLKFNNCITQIKTKEDQNKEFVTSKQKKIGSSSAYLVVMIKDRRTFQAT